MTKINKLGKSTFIIAILSFLLVAVLAFGGTYAYFSVNTEGVQSTVTTAHLTLESNIADQGNIIATNTIIVPGQTLISDALSVEYTANAPSVIIAVIDLKVDGSNNLGTGTTTITAANLGFELATGWTKVSVDGATSSCYVLGTDATPYVSTNSTEGGVPLTTGPVKLGLNVSGEDNMDVVITINVRFVACQYEYIKDAQGNAWGTGEDAPTCAQVYDAVRAQVISDLPDRTATPAAQG